MKKNNKNSVLKPIEAEGVMTYGQLENGMHIFDFQCLEAVEMVEVCANFKVRQMRDGNVYMTEIPKRERNTPIFRDDNSSLSLGKDGKYYFFFALPEQLVDNLPAELVRQASAIANKVIRELLTSN
ncbi:MAG: hypothetical protein IJV42_05775 [Bacteroidaceae bacterium]|nr:hypothetical protein [Bacteroidaceae bacterium]